MSILTIVLLAVVQGIAELLPVSSSAHVIVTEKLLGLDPSAPEMTFLLVMLHTGTMFAVLFYFWPKWRAIFQQAPGEAGALGRVGFIKAIVIATGCTGMIGFGLKIFIEKVILAGEAKAEVEQLFKSLPLIAASLFGVGVLIIIASRIQARRGNATAPLDQKNSAIIGIVQGLCLPLRGFSRSGATISVGMLRQIPRDLSETFSFALAVVLTPPVIVIEGHRLLKAAKETGAPVVPMGLFGPGLIGMACSLVAGLVALRWLSNWLEKGRWHFFGYYCLVAAVAVALIHTYG